MNKHCVIGLDLAKSVFQVHIANESGKKIGGKKLKRGEVMAWLRSRSVARLAWRRVGAHTNGPGNWWLWGLTSR